MKAVWAIIKRDLKGLFLSPVVYAIATVFMILTGLLFYSNLVVYIQLSFSGMQNPYWSQPLNLATDFMRPLGANFAVIFLFLMPVITMRSFSEEKRSGTLELLSTYPVRDSQLVLGKFLAVLITAGLILVLTWIYPAFLFVWGSPEISLILLTYAGFAGMLAVFTATGIFASAATENQIIAALTAFGLNLMLWLSGWLSPRPDGLLHDVLNHLSIITHFEPMMKGIVSITNMVYFVTMTMFFLFLTNRVLESRRWRG